MSHFGGLLWCIAVGLFFFAMFVSSGFDSYLENQLEVARIQAGCPQQEGEQ